MHLLVAARHELSASSDDERQPMLLLEGGWPTVGLPAVRRSLDDAIDVRFAWIDVEASRLAEQVIESAQSAGPVCLAEASPAYLNALALRYYLVKLIRPIVYFTEIQPLCSADGITADLCRGRDEDYGEVLEQLCSLSGAACHVRWTGLSEAAGELSPPPQRWRRWLDLLRRPLEPRANWSDPRPRVVLCGNPRILDPVCREFLDRSCAVWWLYDRLALKAWLRWHRAGAGQLVCNSELGKPNRFRSTPIDFCAYRGVDLSGVIGRWISHRLVAHGGSQGRLLEQMDAHFRQVRPDALVLDQDATPTARAAVAVARHHQVPSFVLQHGAPVCRFGFAPPAADRLLVWGMSSQRQLEAWDVAPERLCMTGSPVHDELTCRLTEYRQERLSDADRRLNILLLATTPPRNERPDSVAFHLTEATYEGMVRAAFAAVAKRGRARLIVKLHPRSPGDPVVRKVAAEYPSVETEFVESGPLEALFAWANCVFSCASSAGIDATLTGVPVVQLLPAGSAEILPHGQWGLIGSARTEEELDELLCRALIEGRRTDVRPNPNVFSNTGDSARAVVDVVLAAGGPSCRAYRREIAWKHFGAARRSNRVERVRQD